ncbi:type VI secretion system-associated protein TagF [Paracraurococcus lichenis]|uniref:Type VI secretion system-associated protein TagF n=1 Tax=Paracraurococcus lichenis TaxID=3064888 RepID=A0ABT9DXX5_9PROT|nr:type VI secretion system-associated protein TagF [Paracraurococcus sp. LOR1-02]MDO9708751.1 type VI secretion system-associated protein TagF [Paracraurococcus sp. LOR1-02]
MSGAVTAPAMLGFLGKLPARGDFVARGLPRSFREPWDAWAAAVMPASRAVLGETWLPAWLEAPVWRFALPPGLCGPMAATGVWLPSVDRAGRHWPLAIAAVLPGLAAAPAAEAAWLDALEAAGVAAVTEDVAPDALAARLAPLAGEAPRACLEGMTGAWWTAGAPRVAPRRFGAAALPEVAAFAAMLSDTGQDAEGEA